MNDEPKRIRLQREDLRRTPHAGWSAFVAIATGTDDWQRLAPSQRVAWLAFHYDADVTTGGHRKFLDHADEGRLAATRAALEALGATGQLHVLDLACSVLRRPGTSDEIDDQLDDLDRAYHAHEPDVPELLERWLAERLPEFVDLID